MKTSSKTLLIAALLAVPFTATHAANEAWIRAQKIDIQPTLKITETEIPADTATGSTGSSATTPGAAGSQSAPSTYQPSMPSTPSSSGGYAPASPSTNMPSQDRTPGYITPGVNSGSGVPRQ